MSAPTKDAGPKALSVVEALGLAPEKAGKAAAKSAVEHVRERHEDGRFKAKLEQARAKANPPKPKPEPVAPAPESEDDPNPEPITPTAPVVPKVKIGDKEMSPEEVAAYVAELEKKAATPTPPPKTELPIEKPEPTAEEQAALDAAEQQKIAEKRQQFIAARAQDFNPQDFGIQFGEAELDTILAGGPQAVQNFMGLMSKIVAATEARAWERAHAAIHERTAKIDETLRPMTEREKAIAEWEAANSFFEEYKDLSEYRTQVSNIRRIISEKYPTEWAAMTQKERNAEVAGHVRDQIREWGGKPAEPTPAPAADPKPATVPAPVAPRPAPPRGQSPNGGAPTPRSTARSLLPEP